MDQQKRCTGCGETKPLSEFHKAKNNGPLGVVPRCKLCVSARRAEWAERNRETIRSKARERRAEGRYDEIRKAWYLANGERIKEKVRLKYRQNRDACIDAYGGACRCCGETERAFLTLDHVNDDGWEHRKSMGTNSCYGWAVKHGFPSSLQLLCANCNMAKTRPEGCPHRLRSSADATGHSSVIASGTPAFSTK